MRNFLVTFFFFFSLGTIQGCGQTGPLYLPEETESANTSEQQKLQEDN